MSPEAGAAGYRLPAEPAEPRDESATVELDGIRIMASDLAQIPIGRTFSVARASVARSIDAEQAAEGPTGLVGLKGDEPPAALLESTPRTVLERGTVFVPTAEEGQKALDAIRAINRLELALTNLFGITFASDEAPGPVVMAAINRLRSAQRETTAALDGADRANSRLAELSGFLRERFGVTVENDLNAAPLAIAKLEDLQRRLVKGGGK